MLNAYIVSMLLGCMYKTVVYLSFPDECVYTTCLLSGLVEPSRRGGDIVHVEQNKYLWVSDWTFILLLGDKSTRKSL